MSNEKRSLQRTFDSLIGRKIVAIKPHIFACDEAGKGARTGWTSDPTIIFDDGSTLSFCVDETEIGEYGLSPVRTKGKR